MNAISKERFVSELKKFDFSLATNHFNSGNWSPKFYIDYL